MQIAEATVQFLHSEGDRSIVVMVFVIAVMPLLFFMFLWLVLGFTKTDGLPEQRVIA